MSRQSVCFSGNFAVFLARKLGSPQTHGVCVCICLGVRVCVCVSTPVMMWVGQLASADNYKRLNEILNDLVTGSPDKWLNNCFNQVYILNKVLAAVERARFVCRIHSSRQGRRVCEALAQQRDLPSILINFYVR